MPGSEPFYIAFDGSPDQLPSLQRFLAEVKTVKGTGELSAEQVRRAVGDSKWIDLLDSATLQRLTDGKHWSLEDILDCLLKGEYELLGIEFADGSGRLLYDPFSFPFGGTGPLKGLVQAFGYEVTRDSFHDGFAEWQSGRA
jgi:hypothetical protein